MRNSVGLAGLLFCFIASVTSAQSPSNCRGHRTKVFAPTRYAAPQQSVCRPLNQVSRCGTTHVVSACGANQKIVQNYQLANAVVQNCPVVASGRCVPSTPHVLQPALVVSPPSVVAANAGTGPMFGQVVAPPCACSAGGATPPYLHAQNDYSQIGGIYLQDRSNIQNRRSPFSLAGHVREGSKPLDFCLQEFLACCERGGKDCILNYYKCAEITGEPIRHTVCPSEEPTIDE